MWFDLILGGIPMCPPSATMPCVLFAESQERRNGVHADVEAKERPLQGQVSRPSNKPHREFDASVFDMFRSLAEYILERENKKSLLARVEVDIFKTRYQLEDWSGSIMSSLRPVSTRSDTTATGRPTAAVVGDGWESRSSLVSQQQRLSYAVEPLIKDTSV